MSETVSQQARISDEDTTGRRSSDETNERVCEAHCLTVYKLFQIRVTERAVNAVTETVAGCVSG